MTEEDYRKSDETSASVRYALSNAAVQTFKLSGYDIITGYDFAINSKLFSNMIR